MEVNEKEEKLETTLKSGESVSNAAWLPEVIALKEKT